MAMSYGLPAVVSNLPAMKEVVQHNENGLLFNQMMPMTFHLRSTGYCGMINFEFVLGKKKWNTVENTMTGK